jgi:hypothetical protein
MTVDMVVLAIANGIAIAVVLYAVWSNRHREEESGCQRDQDRLWRDLQSALNRNEIIGVRRHAELQRQLAEHLRILKYLARRLS